MIKIKSALFTLISLLTFSALGQQVSVKNSEPNLCEDELKKTEQMLDDERLKVQRATYLFTAQQIAGRSLSVNDFELSALLAIQAANFNKQYSGYKFDSRIFKSLYYALEIANRLPIKSNSATFIESELFSIAEANKHQMLSLILKNEKSEIENMWSSPSGHFMVTHSNDLYLRIWNLKEVGEEPILIRVGQRVKKIFFSKDELQIGVLIDSNTFQVWPLNSESMVNELCGMVNRGFTPVEWDLYVASYLSYEKTCP